MQKIGSSTTTANALGEFTEGNPGQGVDATLIKAAWLNTLQREVVNIIQGAGLTLNAADDAQLLKAVQALQAASIQQAAANLVASSPATLDTLNELAHALGNDPNFATTITSALAGKANSATTLAGYGISLATQPDAEAGIDNAKPMSALRVFQAIAKVLVQATETAFGWAKVATQGQTNSGVDDTTFVTPKKFSAGIAALVIQATEAVKGIARIATQAQVNAGSGDDVMVTPYKLRLGFAVSFNAQGYVVFPPWLGGLIIQWTSSAAIAPGATGAAYWPIAFPNGCIWALAAPLGNSGNSNAANIVAGGVSAVAVNLYNWGSAINSPARVIAIGV